MKKIVIFLLSSLLCVISHVEAETSALVDQYLKTRDGFINRFEKKQPTDSEMKQAYAELERQLKVIIGPVKIDGSPMQGTISLASLYRGDLGFGQVDGLIRCIKEECIFATTLELLHSYLKHDEKLPRDLKLLSRNEEIYSRTLSSDAAVSNFGEIPIKSTAKDTYVYAFLGLTAQDIGPWVPDTLFVFYQKDNHVFFVSSHVKQKINQIPECKGEWDKFASKSSDALAKYDASGLKDKKAFNEHIRYEEEGYKAYRGCFAKRAITQQFFKPLSNHVQSIVDRIQ